MLQKFYCKIKYKLDYTGYTSYKLREPIHMISVEKFCV